MNGVACGRAIREPASGRPSLYEREARKVSTSGRRGMGATAP
jgi:hypothetical protein